MEEDEEEYDNVDVGDMKFDDDDIIGYDEDDTSMDEVICFDARTLKVLFKFQFTGLK